MTYRISRTGRRRLRQLADYLDELPPEWFDLRSWASEGWKKHKCGSTACAVGWATVRFKRSGLKLKCNGRLIYRGQISWDAARLFFGLPTLRHAYHLFSHESYPPSQHRDPKAVAKRLREVADMQGNHR